MNLYVFDVDGVLTNTVVKKVNKEVLKEIVYKLNKGDFISLNSGRSFNWVHERILKHIQEIARPERLKKQFFISCEMGNVTAIFNGNSWDKWTNPSALIPEELIGKVKDLIQKDFSESMFFDEKETMISVEVKDGFNEAEYLTQQKILLEKIKQLLQGNEYKNLRLQTGSNLIALDVKPEDSGKKLGAQRIIEYMEKNSSTPSEVLCFGDNVSDFEMAEVFKKKYKTEFIFVGNEKEKIANTSKDNKVTITENLFDLGTLDRLRYS